MTPPPPRDELRFTQNFLHSPALVQRLVTLANLPRGGTVLEIGPGKGIITKALAGAVGADGRVVAVELDAALAANLRGTFAQTPQIHIIHTDILRYKLSELPRDYAVFANVPFNITSALLEMLFNPADGPAQAHLILQRETLIAASEHSADADTFKSMMIKPLYDIAAVHTFARSDFRPPPAVDTALFAFTRRESPLVDPARYPAYKDFLAVVSKDRAGEGAWRKLFSTAQLARLAADSGLVAGRGLKSQPADAIAAAFRLFLRANPAKLPTITGAMAALRAEQARRDSLNRTGHHRRKTRP